MGFVPIELRDYVRLFLQNNHGESGGLLAFALSNVDVARIRVTALNPGLSIAQVHMAEKCFYETRNAALALACRLAAGAIECAPDVLPEDFIPADGVRWPAYLRTRHPSGLGRH